ncbi:MAG: phytoene desaturase family protein [Flavobacteriales bacterium]|nr:phytoene desaturase family protein [Flavobacteriales bacterium]
MKAAIIGSGIGGIATAIRFKAKGYDVDVFERNNFYGGKLSEEWINGYRFDAGPSLFTMPQFVEELFELLGENPQEHFPYYRLETICNYFWEDGTRFSATADLDVFAKNIESTFGEPQTQVKRYLSDCKQLYELTADLFIHSSFHRLDTFLSNRFFSKLIHIPKLRAFHSLNQENERYFKHPKIIQLFNRYATYNGSSPYIAPGTLKVIPSLEYFYGAYLPEKGMIQIPNALVALAKRHGVRFYLNAPVEEILHNGRRVTGIRVHGESKNYDLVVSNADVVTTYDKLIKNVRGPKRIYSQERSSSALVFNWGIKRTFPELDVHNIFFSDDYFSEFNALFKTKTLWHDPTVYIFISCKKVQGDAPEGCENWFTMINAPHIAGQDWDQLIQQARKHILGKLTRILGTPIEPLIEAEWIFDPRQIENRTSSYLGSLYGTSSNSMMAAFNRHPNFTSRLKNLYFVGGSVHPGGGIPLCLSSAKIVSQIIS